MISISADFDHGNINVLQAAEPADIRLEIASDGAADFFQWFYFRVETTPGERLTMRIMNAAGASYVDGWQGYNAVASYDNENWFRVNSDYQDGILSIEHAPEKDVVYYAYFAAYPYARVANFVTRMRANPDFRHQVLGESLDGRAMDYFSIGTGPKNLWLIARQHPGETMASWWMEGFLPEIAGDTDAAKLLRKEATIHMVPCMNPDGAARGHLRTNAGGIDLNRAWRNTTAERSPEVYFVREKMRETGVDLFLDVHGDEAIPNNFLDAATGIPTWDETHEARFNAFSSRLLEISKDFQTEDGYPDDAPGQANLDIASKYVAETWNCLSMTLEMPFKDANINPMPDVGWSPARCRQFARDHVKVIADVIELL